MWPTLFQVLQQRKALGLDKAFEEKWKEREIRELEERMELRPRSREAVHHRPKRRSYSRERERYDELPRPHKRHRGGEDAHKYFRRELEIDSRRPPEKRPRENSSGPPPITVKSEPVEPTVVPAAVVKVKREEGDEKEEGEISSDDDDAGEGAQVESKGALASLLDNYGDL